jgi:L-threonylcarbamoyladenylate synthase
VTDLDRAIQFLRQGRLVAFPTETVYGLGADATNPAAVDRIYRTKGRPGTNPLILHVASADIAKRYVTAWPPAASNLAQRFWPGPLTLVLHKQNVIPDNATANLPTVALRVPDHPLALELLRAFDGPLAAPSANRSTRVSPTTARHVFDEFPDSAAAGGADDRDPALILDGGPCTVGIESTVLDLTGPTPTILRPGRITAADLEPVIGHVAIRGATIAPQTPAASPGQHAIHYAPHTSTFRYETGQKPPPGYFGIIALTAVDARDAGVIAMPSDPAEYARRIYGALRELDALNLPAIYVEMPPDRPEWGAVRDRLTRASRPLA